MLWQTRLFVMANQQKCYGKVVNNISLASSFKDLQKKGEDTTIPKTKVQLSSLFITHFYLIWKCLTFF